MTKLKILAFAGSLRKDSINKKLIKWACLELKNFDVTVTFVDLIDYPLPIYNPDLTPEEFPKNAIILEKLMLENDAWLIASPENNFSITSVLKNLIDYVSRAPENKPNMGLFTNKIVSLMAASPSGFGGVRGITHIREILTTLGSIVLPAQATLSNAYVAFDEQGNLIDIIKQKAVRVVLAQLVEIGSKLIRR